MSLNRVSILLFDTALESSNLGDQIIMESVDRVLASLFPHASIARVPTHRFPRWNERRLMRGSTLRIVGGTNLLSSNMDVYRQWRLHDRHIRSAADSILMGVGWWQYQDPPDDFTVDLLHRLLDHDYLHSVRDSYTERMLRAAGFTNVINTGCPTLWSLTTAHCAEIPTGPAHSVVATVTDYNMSPEDDAFLLQTLSEHYERVYLWGQSQTDIDYGRVLNGTIVPVEPTLQAFDDLLAKTEIDYVGTRLHAGIRAIQRKRRALIIAIDNRATEMAKDFSINTIERREHQQLSAMIRSPLVTSIRVPRKAITAWKEQFEQT